MPRTYICRLVFHNALHVGAARYGIGLEGAEGPIIHSDTLWAALCNHWAVLGKVHQITFEDFLASFKEGRPLFTLSSAFPFTDDVHYWLPRPLMEPLPLRGADQDAFELRLAYGAKIKEKSFIRRDQWVQWDQSSLRPKDLVQTDERGQLADTVRPHNTVDRISGQTTLYHAGLTYFDPSRSGLYFLLKAENEEVRDTVASLLEIIRQTAGFGGNVNTGSGNLKSFEIFPAGGNWAGLDTPPASGTFCLLSLYHPKSVQNAAAQAIAYNLIQRKGWTGSLSTLRQAKYRTVWMFSEGSTFKGALPRGQLVDVTPQTMVPDYPHDVFRYGLALAYPLESNPEDDSDV